MLWPTSNTTQCPALHGGVVMHGLGRAYGLYASERDSGRWHR
jgi:hypothetical protein